MSTASRLISGSLASWALIAVTMASQIILVPVYLGHWSVKTYGIWLALQGIMNVLSMLDMGYQNYMGFEFLKMGRHNLPLLCKSLWSAIIVATLVSLFQLLLIVALFLTGALSFLLGESGTNDTVLLNQAGVSLILQGITWLIVMSIPGLIVKALAAFGYFSRTAWWGFVYAILIAIAPLIAVIFGADLLMASIAMTAAAMLYAAAFYFQLVILLKKEKIRILKPSFRLGISNFRKSVPLLGKGLLDNMRQQGVRLVLAPLAGAAGLAAFATMRTGANVALQGLNTILNPLLPDLMRFLHNRDQQRSEAAFATIWIVVIAILAPGVVVLQVFIQPFFVFWTQGKISFDPLLFALLSLGVLIYAIVQPAMAVVIGNNLTRLQLALAAIAAAILFALLFVLVPAIGILGAAVALLVAEIVAAIGYKIYAVRWLKENDLVWPDSAFRHALIAVSIAAAALAAIVVMPGYKWLILVASLLFFGWNARRYWLILPSIALQSARAIVVRFTGFFFLARKFTS